MTVGQDEPARVLVAGVGNLLRQDDGFGVYAVQQLATSQLPAGVRARDFGIRGVHLAFELLDGGVDLLVVVDALSRGADPGTLYLFEPDLDDVSSRASGDAHGMDLPHVFASVRSMGGELPRVLLVGCEPEDLGDGIGLSAAVERAVSPAVEMIRELLQRELASPSAAPRKGLAS